MTAATIEHLKSADPKLARVIEQVGPCLLKPDRRRSPFEALTRAVAFQQLNGTAAETIFKRFLGLFPGGASPTPEQVMALAPEEIAAVGFSRAKASYVREIARNTVIGVVPSRGEAERMPDEALIERLTQVKGVGRWTAEMFLIFTLGRADVLPVDDFGIRQGFQVIYRKRKAPDRAALLRQGERWRPYRTTASWYLWRAVDLERERLKAGTS